MRRRLHIFAALGAVLAGLISAEGAGAATPTVTEFSTGSGAKPLGIAAGTDGGLWSTWSSSRRLGRTSPAGLVTSTGQLPTGILPFSIATGPDGKLWFTTVPNQEIRRTDSVSPTFTTTTFTPGAGSIGSITTGPDRDLWFTDAADDQVGKITTAGAVTLYPLGETATATRGITAGPDGNVWFTQGGNNKIGRINPSTATPASPGITRFTLPTSNADPSAITAGPDGNLWFTEANANKIGRITPTGTITEYAIPTSNDQLAGIAAGPDGNLWFTETSANKIGRITPTGAVTEFPIPTGASAPNGITAGPDGNLWFTEYEGDQIARVTTALDPPAFNDTARIAVPGTGSSGPGNGPADRYPATITAQGLVGTVTSVTVRLNGIHHTFGGDIQAQLVGPGGQTTFLTSGRSTREVLNGEVITFATDGLAAPTRLASGIFKPFGTPNPTALPGPAPAVPTASGGGATRDLAIFDGTNPNGDWKLYLNDNSAQDFGAIVGGWSLDIKTTGPPPVVVTPPSTGGGGTSQGGGSTQGGTSPVVPAKRDTTKPRLKLAKLASKTTLAKFRKGVAATITPNEASTVKCTLATTARKPRTLATVTRKGAKAGKATKCKLKPSKKALGKPKKAFKVKLSIAATDAAGNKGTASKTITVKP